MRRVLLLIILTASLLLAGCKRDNGGSDENPITEYNKILSIGNSFSHNALEYFPQLAHELVEKEELIMGHIHIGGSSLETHSLNAQTNSKAYTYNKFVKGEEDKAYPTISIKDALQDEDWDLVIIQQVSGQSGIASSFQPHLNTLVDYIKDNAIRKNVNIAWHMTWAYQSDSNHQDFPNYLNDQLMMYENIIASVQSTVLSNEKIDLVLPAGTAIQNLRTSIVGDYLTDDGYHLNKIGKYTASLVWISKLFGIDISNYQISDSEITTEFNDSIIEAVMNSIQKPYEITNAQLHPWAEKTRYMDSIKLLAIGNSFTANAFEYFAELMKDAGVEKFILAYLYRGGSDLKYHLGQLNYSSPSYSYRKYSYDKSVSPAIKYEIIEDSDAQYGVKDEVWDIITVQQVSGQSGQPNTFDPVLSTLIQEVRKHSQNKDVIFGYHMTWAYAQSTTHGPFAGYNNDQMTMYNAIISTTQEKVLKNPNISFIIPSGTAIQNARTTNIGDNLTIADGYHLNRLGEYIAGLMWVKQLTNVNIDNISYAPVGQGIRDHFYGIKKAVNDAYQKPFVITQGSNTGNTEEPIDPVNPDEYMKITFEYQLGFWMDNATKVSIPPENEDPNALHYKYIATEPISKELFPLGSVIKFEPGFRARIIYFVKEGDTFRVVSRGEPRGGEIVMTEDMWGTYDYIGLNISRDGTPNIAHEIDEVVKGVSLLVKK